MTVTTQNCTTDQLVASVLDLHGGRPVIPHFTDKETETQRVLVTQTWRLSWVIQRWSVCAQPLLHRHIVHSSFPHSFIPSFIHSFPRSFIHSFPHSFIHLFPHSFIPSFIHSLVHSLPRSFTPSFIHSFPHSFIYSLIHSLPHSFTPSFILRVECPGPAGVGRGGEGVSIDLHRCPPDPTGPQSPCRRPLP